MDSAQVVTVLVAVIMAVGASLVTGLLARPKTKAEAGAAEAGGQVAISGDAREWAKQFAEKADRAEKRADAADKRCDDIEKRFDLLVVYTRALAAAWRAEGGHPPTPPPELVPPL